MPAPIEKSIFVREVTSLIDTHITYIPTPADQREPAIAFDGTNYLIVWKDLYTIDAHPCCARLDQNGTLLDPAGIDAWILAYNYPGISVAYGNTNFLIAWTTWAYDIYSARISLEGALIDTLLLWAGAITKNTVAFDGTNYLVAWDDWENANDIFGVRVNQGGQILDSTRIPIFVGNGFQKDPAAAFDGNNYLVVWHDSSSTASDIYGTRLATDGTVLDPGGIPISTATNNQCNPAIAFDGANYFVVYSDTRWGWYQVYATRINSEGIVLDTTGIQITFGQYNHGPPAVAFDGTNFLVTWHDSRNGNADIYCSRVNQEGVVLDLEGLPVSIAAYEQEYPAVSFDGIHYFIAWQDRRSLDQNIYGTLVDTACMVIDTVGICLSMSANAQDNSAIATGDDNFLIVWDDLRGLPNYDIYGKRISQSGTIIDTFSIPICTAPDAQRTPTVAFGANEYLVLFESGEDAYWDVYGVRVNQNGAICDTIAIPICTAENDQLSPALIFGGTNYLAVWDDNRAGGNPHIYGARVSQTGTVLDTANIHISPAQGDNPAVEFDGLNYLVAWQNPNGILCSRVNQDGVVLDPSGIPLAAPGSQECPDIAFDGVNYFVVWQDGRNGMRNIYGTRLTTGGVVIDTFGIPICADTGYQRSPKVAFDGINYIVIWQDDQGNTHDVRGAKVDTTGEVISTFTVTKQEGIQQLPALAHGTGNTIQCTWSGWADSINGNYAKAMRIWGRFYLSGTPVDEMISASQNYPSGFDVYPNPMVSDCIFKYRLPLKCRVSIRVYDSIGRLTKVVTNKIQDAGLHQIPFSIRQLPAGVYFIRLNAGAYSGIKKVVVATKHVSKGRIKR